MPVGMHAPESTALEKETGTEFDRDGSSLQQVDVTAVPSSASAVGQHGIVAVRFIEAHAYVTGDRTPPAKTKARIADKNRIR